VIKHIPAWRHWLAPTLATLVVGGAALLSSGASHASDPGMPECAGVGGVRVLADKLGTLESAAFDTTGRLLYTWVGQQALYRMDSPDATPVPVASGLSAPGGIAVVNAHEAYVGSGNSLGGLVPALGQASIKRVNLDTGEVKPYASGLSMANGLVRTSDGSFYASDDLAKSLDRVQPDGTVQRGWLTLNSNGLALSKDEKTLYVNQFLPAKVYAVDLATGRYKVHGDVPPERSLTGLDGLAIDDLGNLYIAAYFSGEVWRLAPDGQFCRLAKGLSLPSAMVVGQGRQGFALGSLYVVSHSGHLYEVPTAVPLTR
jgi:sugar lactone lactonase YvrE